MSLTVDVIPPEASTEWDSRIKGFIGWTPYHLYGWRRVMEDVYGHECFFLGARGADGSLRGVLPLVSVCSLVFGRFLVSMPFLNYGGPLGGVEAVSALAREAVRIGERERADLVELRSARELPLGLPASHRKITVLLDLPSDDPDLLWKALNAKVRSQVRRPMKEGVEVRFGSDELEGFYSVFARHMRDLGTPVQPRTLFERTLEEFGDMMWFGCAYLGDRPIAAGSGFRWADRFELVWASALREYSRTAPNMLLYWRFMERCIADGAAVFDFGRCTPGGGTHRFKTQWGGQDQQLWWYQHSAKSGGDTPSPDSGPFSFGPKVWSRLPLPIANVLGPRIVKFIP